MWRFKLNADKMVKVGDILDAYTNVSTIAGVVYIQKSQSRLTRTFWLIWITLLLSLAVYSSVVVYSNWRQNPVMTSVDSTGVPLSNFPFPSIVFCTGGNMYYPYYQSFYNEAIELINQFGGEKRKNISESDVESFLLYNDTVSNGSTILDLLLPEVGTSPGPYPLIRILQDFYFFTTLDIVTYSKIITNFWYILTKMNIGDFVGGYFLPRHNLKTMNVLEEYGLDLSRTKSRYIFSTLMSHIWYFRVPCFDLVRMTVVNKSDTPYYRHRDGDTNVRRAFLKECQWRGIHVPCSAIFKTVATDMGLCCGFNMQNAESLFTESIYLKKMIELQSKDKSISLESTTVPAWYVKQNQPISNYGSKMGLQVKLDTHQNLVTEMSLANNFQSITGLITQKGNFPLVRANGFPIVQGHHNLISMSGTIISGDNSLRIIAPYQRQCLFHDESELKLFKSYSQANCVFECYISETQKQMMSSYVNMSTPCTPWYFPFIEKESILCDPYQRKVFDDIFNSISTSCVNCLPDCNAYIYKHYLSLEPFHDCNDFNMMLSLQCNLRDTSAEKSPFLFGDQITQQLKITKTNLSILAKNISKYKTNFRQYLTTWQLLESSVDQYNGFEKDISVVSIFFDTTTVLKFSTMTSSNWTLYFSSVGGTLGLMIALSICTLVELFWLLCQVLSAYFCGIRIE